NDVNRVCGVFCSAYSVAPRNSCRIGFEITCLEQPGHAASNDVSEDLVVECHHLAYRRLNRVTLTLPSQTHSSLAILLAYRVRVRPRPTCRTPWTQITTIPRRS